MRQLFDHLILTAAALIMGAPLVMLVASAAVPGGLSGLRANMPSIDGLWANLSGLARFMSENNSGPTLADMVLTSALAGAGVALVTTALSFLAAFGLSGMAPKSERRWLFLILLTLYFPVEARMLPTFDIAAQFGLVNTLAGLVLPVLPLAMATFILRQHIRSLPAEVIEAARLDAAGPIRMLFQIVLPLSLVPLGAVLTITFIIGWNQYLWPLMISVDNTHFPLMRGLNLVGAGGGASMVLATVSVLPPLVLVLAFLRLMSRVTAARI